jgi:hypothetical protein
MVARIGDRVASASGFGTAWVRHQRRERHRCQLRDLGAHPGYSLDERDAHTGEAAK